LDEAYVLGVPSIPQDACRMVGDGDQSADGWVGRTDRIGRWGQPKLPNRRVRDGDARSPIVTR